MWKWFKWILISIGILGFLFFNIMFWGNYGHFKDTDYNNPPIFITHDFIDLNKVDSITKYRSGVGHDYSGNGETCRSMRHYFGHASASLAKGAETVEDKMKLYVGEPSPSDSVEIYAPADGMILSISGEDTNVGKQIEMDPDNANGWHIRLDHVYPVKGIHMLIRVKAGQLIARTFDGQTADMTVLYNYRGKFRLTSYFLVMTDEVFAQYQARGVQSRSQMIIPKEVVDANPWECAGGDKNTPSFAKNYADTVEGEAMNYVHINGYVPNVDIGKKEETEKDK